MLGQISLALELWRWRRAGAVARLWWRDDDAVGASAALDRLLQASRAVKAPLTLAVVPTGDMRALGERLARATLVNVAQHGVDHVNRRTGKAAGEVPHDWQLRDMEIVLRQGWSLMQDMPRARAVFVPPWNDEHPQLRAALLACGYAGWSANGRLVGGEGAARVDVHLDLLRWRGGARFRGRGRFLADLTAELRRRREAGLWSAPIGMLTHHLVHDERAWAFLESFLVWTARRPEFAWTALPDLLAEGGPGRQAPARPSRGRHRPRMALAATSAAAV